MAQDLTRQVWTRLSPSDSALLAQRIKELERDQSTFIRHAIQYALTGDPKLRGVLGIPDPEPAKNNGNS